uniref:Adenosine kinase n=1 Tax=Tabanus bromius TaxID=304241 RepID=A0A0K8TT13_TABBR
MEYLRSVYTKVFGENDSNISAQEAKCINKPKIIAFGNVLLDMTVKLGDTELLTKYNLGLDSQGEIDIEILQNITEDLSSRTDIEYNPGGSALNSCRILKKVGNVGCLFFGCVGQDKTAKILKNILIDKGIETRLQEQSDYPTGQCFCFVYGNHNCLYANVGASEKLSVDFIMDSQSKLNFLSEDGQLQFFYLEGFFVPKRTEVCKFIVENYVSGNRKLCFNLNAPYIILENIEIVQYLIEHSFIVFGNQNDFLALAQGYGLKAINDVVHTLLESREKILIITNGPDEVNVFENNGEGIQHSIFPVDRVPENEIVDITGAGDSFAAAFLDAFIGGKELSDCITIACKIARLVVTQIGCNLP